MSDKQMDERGWANYYDILCDWDRTELASEVVSLQKQLDNFVGRTELMDDGLLDPSDVVESTIDEVADDVGVIREAYGE